MKTSFARWLFLAFSATLIIVWIILKRTLAVSALPSNVTIVYPLYALMSSLIWRWVILAGLCLSIILLHRATLRRHLPRRIVTLSLLIQGTVLLFGLFFFSASPFFTQHLQTLSANQHTYHLVLTQDRGYFEAIRRYDMLECDRFGLLCQHYATPYQREGDCFSILASIAIDPNTQHLLLNLDRKTYDVNPANSMGWTPCPLTGLTR